MKGLKMQEMTAAEIKAARAQLGMSQVKFAEAIGVTNVAVAQWETDKRTPAPYLRLAVAALVAGLEPWRGKR
jgi:DNA-binding transcriptional regulator YiaG